MKYAFITAVLLASAAQTQEFAAPSGLTVQVGEVILDPDLGFARFRFVAPDMGSDGFGFEQIEGDFVWMCETFAVPALAQADWQPDEIVISLADRDVPFGSSDPDAIQFFTGFTTDGTTCTEEMF